MVWERGRCGRPFVMRAPAVLKPGERRHARDHEGRERRHDRQAAAEPLQGRRDRWRRGWLLDPLPPREVRVEGRDPAGAGGAHGRIVVARGGNDPHAFVGSQYLPPAGLHHQSLQGDRGDLGSIRRLEQHRRFLSRVDAGVVRLSEARALQGALHGARPGVHLTQGGRRASPADRPEALLRGALGRARRRSRPLRRDLRLRQVGPRPRRAVFHAHPGGRDQPASGRLVGRGHAARHGPSRARRELRRALGARGRPHGGRRAAGAADGAPLPHHRADPDNRRADGGGGSRAPAGRHRL